MLGVPSVHEVVYEYYNTTILQHTYTLDIGSYMKDYSL